MINKAFLFFLVVILTLPFPFKAATLVASLPDILKPRMIAVDDDTIYITDQESLFVYSLSKFELVKRIGQKGKGPEEYVYTPYVQILKDLRLTELKNLHKEANNDHIFLAFALI